MVKRVSSKEVTDLFRQFPCVVILGPRQVGKTTLAKELTGISVRPSIHLDMERSTDRTRLLEAEFFLEEHRDSLVVIDEVQLISSLFMALRPEIDALRKPGRFLLTGSASPEMVRGASESLAGRAAYYELFPITLDEAIRSRFSMKRHWFRGGFPLSLLAKSNTEQQKWCEHFVRSYVERDLSALFGVGITASLARNFWSMLAIGQGNIWNAEAMSRSLGVSSPTVSRYLEFLEGAFLVRRLPAWFINARKRMVKAPKVYIRDTGLLHYLCNVGEASRLPGHPIVGASWEGYVIEEICKKLPHHIRPYYYRTHHGAEVDLILANGVRPVSCIEIKFGLNPSLKESYHSTIRELKTKKNFVIYAGEKSYKIEKNITVISLEAFLKSQLTTLFQ
jgi:predicted AAA+ superfamily ATPase